MKIYKLKRSHTGTVVTECFKDDSKSQWKNGKFGPVAKKTPNRSSQKLSWVITLEAKFGHDRSRGFCLPYMRSCPRKWLGYCFDSWGGAGSDNSPPPRRLHRFGDFDAQYVKRRRFAQGYVFWGSRKQIFTFWSHPSQKSRFFGQFLKIFRSNWALTLRVPGENVLYSWSYAFGSWMLNRQLDLHESNYMIFCRPKVDFTVRNIVHAQTWIGKFKPKSHSISTTISQKP